MTGGEVWWEWKLGEPMKFARSPMRWRSNRLHAVKSIRWTPWLSGVDAGTPDIWVERGRTGWCVTVFPFSGAASTYDLYDALPDSCVLCPNCARELAASVERDCQRQSPEALTLDQRSVGRIELAGIPAHHLGAS